MSNDKYWKDFFDKLNKEYANIKFEKPKETDVIGYDLLGYPYNKKYPANVELYGNSYEGYSSPYCSTLLQCNIMIWSFPIMESNIIVCPNQIMLLCVTVIFVKSISVLITLMFSLKHSR